MSQNSVVLPVVGTVSGLQMTQSSNAALDTLRTHFSGASAPASSEGYQFWYDTTNNVLKTYSADETVWIPLFSFNQTTYKALPVGQVTFPQGRLTLVSSAAVPSSDVSSATAVYYTPYQGSVCPIYDGSSFINRNFSTTTLTLSSGAHSSGRLYDIFAFNSSGTFTLGAGVAWATASSRASSGVLTQSSGIWLNGLAVTLTNGSSTYSVSSGYATYLGTMYCTGNGTTAVLIQPAAASGGTNNIIGIWNAFNRVDLNAVCRDSSASWTYSSTTFRVANNSASNRISWVDGLQQSAITSTYTQLLVGASSTGPQIAIGLNSSSASSSPIGQGNAGATNSGTISTSVTSVPLLGFNYVQALENINTGTTACTFFGNGYQALYLRITY